MQMIERAAIEGEVVQEAETKFGLQFKVDWKIPSQDDMELRTIWEITSTKPHPPLISAFIK
ncbi:MAG: hypothetical protein N5P05_004282 (plasmid) [Chroococcopsis gigantea SAG 12.99]|jgi:hypothetical protein|nr:hypothetical protein [Chroococcopsis gigantea SAG 12.99]